MAHRNPLQSAVDAAVRAAREERDVLAFAERGRIAPESLSQEEIKRICDFAVAHAECWERSKAG